MQTVSDAVRQLLDSYAKVTLSVYVDGEKLDAGVGAGSYTGACAGDDEFSFGNACAAGVNITLAVSRPDLKGRRIQITWAVDGTEYPLITGKVEKAKVTAGRTEVEAWDDMYYAGSKAFAITSAVTGTCTAEAAFTAVAEAMGVAVEASALAMLSDLTLPDGLSELGSDVTNSAVAGYIAAMVGGNALMSRAGLLTIRQYAAIDWETEPYSGGASAENEDFTVTGITLQREKTVSTLNEDGSTTERTSSEEYLSGDGSLLLTNPLSSQAAADSAFAALSAVTVRPGNYSFPGGLLLEPGDIFTVHSMDGSYTVAVGSISMSFDGGVSSSVACGGAAEDTVGIKGAINQALKALVADYAKFKKLTADNTEINSAHILELLVGDIIADRIKAGIIKSKDGESVVIDLDKGEGTFTGILKTTTSKDDTYSYYTIVTPGGVDVIANDDITGAGAGSASLSHGGLFSHGTGGTVRLFPPIANYVPSTCNLDIVHDSVGAAGIGVFPANPDMGEDAKAFLQLTNFSDYKGLGLVVQGGRSKITGLTAPVDASDATNKEYVDGQLATKAPAGYGLGESSAQLASWTDVDSITKPGWYRFSTSVQIDTAWSISSPFMRVDAWDANTCVQTIYSASSPMRKMIRVRVGGYWQGWEFEAPPGYPGYEARLTERWNSKPVYWKLISMGTLASAGSAVRKAHGISSVNFISCRGVAINTSVGTTLELVNGCNNGSCYVEEGYAIIHSNVGLGSYKGYVVLKYTK